MAISFVRAELHQRLTEFAKAGVLPADLAQKYGVPEADKDSWNIQAAIERARKAPTVRIELENFRPFEKRHVIYDRAFIARPNHRIFDQLIDRDNLALVCVRALANLPFHHAFVADGAGDQHFISTRTKEGGQFFPLYLYPPSADATPAKRDLFGTGTDPFANRDRIENIAPAFRTWLDARLGVVHSPEALLGYIYAILHAPAYRTAYADFLRSDFPRIPFPEDNAAFVALAALGEGLVAAHLLRNVPKRGLGGYTGKGDNRVETIDWRAVDSRIVINAHQTFADVPQAVWEFTIGGYQVLRQYLKARKGRVLTLDEIENVENVVNVLAFTIDRMAEIDAAYIAAFAAA